MSIGPTAIDLPPADHVIERLEATRNTAIAAKEDAGHSEAGRRWSIIVTELEKLEALVRFYGTDVGLEP